MNELPLAVAWRHVINMVHKRVILYEFLLYFHNRVETLLQTGIFSQNLYIMQYEIFLNNDKSHCRVGALSFQQFHILLLSVELNWN